MACVLPSTLASMSCYVFMLRTHSWIVSCAAQPGCGCGGIMQSHGVINMSRP